MDSKLLSGGHNEVFSSYCNLINLPFLLSEMHYFIDYLYILSLVEVL